MEKKKNWTSNNSELVLAIGWKTSRMVNKYKSLILLEYKIAGIRKRILYSIRENT